MRNLPAQAAAKRWCNGWRSGGPKRETPFGDAPDIPLDAEVLGRLKWLTVQADHQQRPGRLRGVRPRTGLQRERTLAVERRIHADIQHAVVGPIDRWERSVVRNTAGVGVARDHACRVADCSSLD